MESGAYKLRIFILCLNGLMRMQVMLMFIQQSIGVAQIKKHRHSYSCELRLWSDIGVLCWGTLFNILYGKLVTRW